MSPRPHLLNLEVAILEDRRPPGEVEWADAHRYSEHLSHVITDRISDQLLRSRVFLEVKTRSGPTNSSNPRPTPSPLSQNVDVSLVGSLSHFYSRTSRGGKIEAHVEFSDLKLYSTRTGRLVWEGASNKEIKRVEINPGRETQYAAEALRGAINQVAMQLSQVAFEREPLFGSGEVKTNAWRVGVLPLSDRRGYENPDVRNFNNNIRITKYAYDKQKQSLLCSILRACSLYGGRAEPGVDIISAQWIQKIAEARIYGRIIRVPIQDQGGPEDYQKWYEEGVDAVLIGNMAASYASVSPPGGQEPFPVWSGGMGFHRLFKVVAFTQFQEIRLVATRDGRVIWQGDAEDGIDHTLPYWPSVMEIAMESVNSALDRLVGELNRQAHSAGAIPPPV